MSMIYDFIDISWKRVDAVDTSQQPPAEREQRIPADAGRQAPLVYSVVRVPCHFARSAARSTAVPRR
jgi:hypothetical protein